MPIDVRETLGEYLETIGVDVKKETNKITNIIQLGPDQWELVGDVLTDIVSGQTGETHFIINQSDKESDQGIVSNHGIKTFNKSIAVYNTILEIFKTKHKDMDYDSLTDNLKFVVPKVKKVKRFLESLDEIVQADDADDVAEFAKNIKAKAPTDIEIYFYKDFSQSAIKLQADSHAGLYSILKLNPFIVTGVDYTHLNVEDYLEKKSYSDNFIKDRSKFLYYTMNKNTTDIEFEDKTLDYSIKSATQGPKYIFGKDDNDDIAGAEADDRLYGMGGNDIMRGEQGDDFLEGGKGRDTMYGGNGNDIFYIAGKDKACDIFNGGDGQLILLCY